MEQLCGVEKVNKEPMEPYSDLVCDFLDEYSSALRKDVEAKQYSDVLTFAFWARKGNIQQHLADGNANIVRVPSRKFPQVDCMCRILQEIFIQKKYNRLYQMTSILRYEKDRQITDKFSACCNMRVIWGGDDTICDIRKSELPPRSTEITFADRYSFGIINAEEFAASSQGERQRLAEGFYNDTYLMDQNACSTPHLICWQLGSMSMAQWNQVQNEFWILIQKVAEKYDLEDIKVTEKYTMLCEKVIISDAITNIKTYNNILYVCDIRTLAETVVTDLRGKYGLFYQYPLKDLKELQVLCQEKVQTCAYFGIEPSILTSFIKKNQGCGIDRIVPFGKTLDIDVVWDGYDLIAEMSRVIGVV